MMFVNLNGNIIDASTPVYNVLNRLRFGDGFFESMRMFNRSIAFMDKHFKRIQNSILALQMTMPESFNQLYLEKEILKLAHKNEYEFARVRIQFFRNGEGRYLPVNNSFSYIIEMENDGIKSYANHSIKHLGLSKQFTKPKHEIGSVKSSSALLYVLASIEAQNQGYDEMILLNTNQEICEALSSNVFIAKNNIVYSPEIKSGCVDGVMRKSIIEILNSKNYMVKEFTIIETELENADEIFLTNASKGIQSVEYFLNQKMKSNTLASFLTKKLNEHLAISNIS